MFCCQALAPPLSKLWAVQGARRRSNNDDDDDDDDAELKENNQEKQPSAILC